MFVGNSINKNSCNGSIMRFNLVLLVIFVSVCTLSITNLDMFRLGLDYIDPFVANVPILYPLKTPGNQKAFGFFRGV